MSFDSKLSELTPVMQQYLAVKKEHKDALLFYQMGDFYELFYEDAEIASNVLNIILTKKQIKNQDIPMCGVPCHSYENYLNRLIKEGYKVAICEQQETPAEAKQRGGSKSVIRRDVVRVVTAGTLTEDSLLSKDSFNYLLAIKLSKKKASCAWVDISTGDFWFQSTDIINLQNVLYRVNPKEVIVNQENENHFTTFKDVFNFTFIPEEKFNLLNNKKLVKSIFTNNSLNQYSDDELISCGILIDYLQITQKQTLNNISPPVLWNENKDVVYTDAFTRQSLELTTKSNGDTSGSLKSIINRTLTNGGSRLLEEWIISPITNHHLINKRLNVVEFFINNVDSLNHIRDIIKNITDLNRSLSRLSLNRGSPKDFLAIKYGLKAITLIQNKLLNQELPEFLRELLTTNSNYTYLYKQLHDAIIEDLELGVTAKDGGYIKKGYSAQLDKIREDSKQSKYRIGLLQESYMIKTQVPNLKIQFNNMLGYYIEVSNKLSVKLLENKDFIHKQTLSNSARFTTEELISEETFLMKSKSKSLFLEQEIFNKLIELVLNQKQDILNVARVISVIDILTSFAVLAKEYKLTKPIVDQSNNFIIKEGRHLVVEYALKKANNEQFISNDCIMEADGNIFLITGPNMAGKSTFLRQNAIIIIMAQIGCFVPASYAHIGVVDAIFSRVGSSDDLYKGQSTFMVEMTELAIILNNATSKSFIILDEIGRGTATYDGLSIAFSTLEYLHNVNKSRTLFATHYHELTCLNNNLSRLKLYSMKVSNYNNELIFMHKVIEGVAGKSYGIHVAKLAGIPKQVLKQAQDVLTKLEKQQNALNDKINSKKELPLFEDNSVQYSPAQASYASVEEDSLKSEEDIKYKEIIDIIENINVDECSPKEALNILYKLKEKQNDF